MYRFNIKKITVSCLVVVFVAVSSLVYADDITDSINEALEYYQNGEFTDAVESLNYASQLIQQKKGEALEAFLPEPLSGWSTEESTSQAAGAAMFGGGITAKRQYRRDESSIEVSILTDSPIMQGVMMMFSKPAFAASEGGKLERIGRQKAIVTFKPKSKQGNIKIIVANRFLVTIEGKKVTKGDLTGYAKAIDYKKMAALP